jgi:hypothetical protein
MKVAMVTTVLVAIGIGPLLFLKRSVLGAGAYRAMFVVSIGALGIAVFNGPTSESGIVLHAKSSLALIPSLVMLVVPVLPFVLLVEAGVAGYRAFSSWLRYGSVALVLLGAIAIFAAPLIRK